MSRPARIAAIVLGSLAGLAIVLVIAALIVVHTGWFRNFVRGKIVAAIDENTGGRSSVGGFNLSVSGLRAEVDDFVLHGAEGPNQPPLFRAQRVLVALKIVSVIHRQVELALLQVDRPQAYVEVKPDGTTNLPTPRVKSTSSKDPTQTLLDLKVGHVKIDDGLLQFADKKTPFNVEGDNLEARMVYHALQPDYTGNISLAPVWVAKEGQPRLPVNTKVAFTIARNRVDLNSADFNTPDSRLHLAANVVDLQNPQGSIQAQGRIDVPEVVRTLGVKTNANLRRTPPLEVNLTAGIHHGVLTIPGLQAVLGASRLDASGAIGNLSAMTGGIRFDGRLALGQLASILGLSSEPEGTVTLAGDAKLNGSGNYEVIAKVAARDVSVRNGAQRLGPINASTDLTATPTLLTARNLRLTALGGSFTGSAEVANMDRARLDGTLRGFDTRYLARTYASRNLVWDGIISGPLHVETRLKAPSIARATVATTRLTIQPGPNGVPLSGLLAANYDGPRDMVNLGSSYLQLPSTRLSLSGAIGSQLRIGLVSRNLNDLLPAIALASSNPPKTLPVQLEKNGVASFNGTVLGSLSDPRISGHVQMTNFIANQQRVNLAAADLSAQKSGATVQNAVVNAPAVEASLSASVGLANWKPEDNQPLKVNASLRSPNVRDLLAAAGSGSTPVSGTLNATAQVAGAIGDPRGAADVTLANGTAGAEPFNRIRTHIAFGGQLIQLTNTAVVLPAGQIDLNVSFEHPPKSFESGRLQFQVTSTPIQVQKLHAAQAFGIHGAARVNASGAASLLPPAPNRSRLQIATFNAGLNAHLVQANTNRGGDVSLVAQTRGQDLDFRLHSDVAQSNINGQGNVRLAGDYPVNASLTFSPIRLESIAEFASPQRAAEPRPWNGLIEGSATVAGPAMRPDELKGKLELTTLQIGASPPAAAGTRVAPRRTIEVRNAGPIVVTLDRQVVTIQSARLTGPGTNFSLAGGVTLRQPQSVDIRANGNIGLDLAQTFDPSIFATGQLVLTAAAKGPLAQPAVNGKLQLVNASLNYLDVPNGLSNANGVILFNGNQAVVQSLTGESGGGKVALSGLVRYGGPEMDFRLRATARQVRVRASTVSVQVNGGIDLAGSSRSSMVSGNVTILEVAMHSHTDIGSMLSSAGGPPSTPGPASPMLAGMRLDVHIDTSPAVQFLTSLTQNLQADAHVQLRGTAAQPGMLGRVTVTQGDIVFFGSKYTIDQGTVAFYNPSRIEPILNVDLSTKARGVDVTLAVTGPIDHMKLTYHSDPPMQFSDLVQLLATGKVPTSDPVLAATQPPAPQQNFEQMGASAVLSQAVASPVSGRLQRLFGVTQLKIDPQIIGNNNQPQATFTLMQQINPDLTFTYIQDVRSSNPQVMRIEWSINPIWSAVALRQVNGEFGLDLYYKKRLW